MTPIWGSSREPDLNAYLSQWASFKLFNHCRGFDPCTTMGVFDQDKLIAVVAFHNYEPEQGVIELSCIAEKKEWLKRHILWEMFSYAFDQLGCQLAVLRVSERNKQWNGRGLPRLLKSYGFTSIRIPRLYGRNEDGILYSLTDEAWRCNGFHKQNKPFNISHSSIDTVAA
jgi:RimJ/RimL family protein N-acetyltransferase